MSGIQTSTIIVEASQLLLFNTFHCVLTNLFLGSFSVSSISYMRDPYSLLMVRPFLQKAISKINSLITHWDRVTHICISKQTFIGPGNGLSPGRRQAFIWTSAAMLWIRTPWANFNEMLNEIYTLSFKKNSWKCHLRNGGHFVSASVW